jgi:hypothetical protein
MNTTRTLLFLTILAGFALTEASCTSLRRGVQPTLADYSINFLDATIDSNQIRVHFNNGPNVP